MVAPAEVDKWYKVEVAKHGDEQFQCEFIRGDPELDRVFAVRSANTPLAEPDPVSSAGVTSAMNRTQICQICPRQ